MKRLHWILYFLIVAVPLTIFPFTINGQAVGPRKIRELAFFSLATIICSWLQKNIWLRLFVSWAVINWWLNLFPMVSYIGLINMLSALVLYIGIKTLLREGILKVDTLLKIICATVLLQLVWVALQKLNLDPFKTQWSNPTGWSGNTGILGIFFATTSFLFLRYCKPLFILMAFPIILLHNFTMALAFAAGGILLLWNKKIYIIAIVIAIGLFALIKPPNLSRLEVWKDTLKQQTQPVIGTGLNTFQLLKVKEGVTPMGGEAHNDYLQLYMETGAVGLFLFLMFIIERFQYLYQRSEKRQLPMLACLVAYLVSMMFWFPMRSAHLSIYAIIILACLEKEVDNGAVV